LAQTTNIYFKDKLWFDEGFQRDKTERKLSKVINLLLNSYYEVGIDEEQRKLSDIEDELLKADAMKARLLKEKERIAKQEAEEKDRYVILGGEDL